MLSSISRSFLPSFSSAYTRSFATKPPRSPLNPELKKKLCDSSDVVYETIVKKVVKQLEPNNYDTIMAKEMPELEQIFGAEANENFNPGVFMAGLAQAIGKMARNIKMNQTYVDQLTDMTKEYSAEEIISAIKTVLPDVE